VIAMKGAGGKSSTTDLALTDWPVRLKEVKMRMILAP
jgi:hypothetical protein